MIFVLTYQVKVKNARNCCKSIEKSMENDIKLTIRRPDDWHLHVRDGDALPKSSLGKGFDFRRLEVTDGRQCIGKIPAVVEEAASPPEHAARSATNTKRATPRRVPATSIPAMWALWQHLGSGDKKIV